MHLDGFGIETVSFIGVSLKPVKLEKSLVRPVKRGIVARRVRGVVVKTVQKPVAVFQEGIFGYYYVGGAVITFYLGLMRDKVPQSRVAALFGAGNDHLDTAARRSCG
jgi:hypothetical protein